MAQIINAEYNSLPQQVQENKNNIAKSNVDITTANANITKNTTDIITANTNIAKNATDITSANANITKNTSDIATANTNIAKNATDITKANANITKNTSDIATANTNIAKNTTDITKNTSDIFKVDNKITKNTNNINSLSNTFIDEIAHKRGNTVFHHILEYDKYNHGSGVNKEAVWRFSQPTMKFGGGVFLDIYFDFVDKHLYKIVLSNTSKNFNNEYNYNIFYGYIDFISFNVRNKTTGLDEMISPTIFYEIFNYMSASESTNFKECDGCIFQTSLHLSGTTETFKRFKKISRVNNDNPNREVFFLPSDIYYDESSSIQPPQVDIETFISIVDLGIITPLT